jgi:hypothetical protein
LLKVTGETEGQIFITDTSGERLVNQLEKLGQPFQLVEL